MFDPSMDCKYNVSRCLFILVFIEVKPVDDIASMETLPAETSKRLLCCFRSHDILNTKPCTLNSIVLENCFEVGELFWESVGDQNNCYFYRTRVQGVCRGAPMQWGLNPGLGNRFCRKSWMEKKRAIIKMQFGMLFDLFSIGGNDPFNL